MAQQAHSLAKPKKYIEDSDSDATEGGDAEEQQGQAIPIESGESTEIQCHRCNESIPDGLDAYWRTAIGGYVCEGCKTNSDDRWSALVDPPRAVAEGAASRGPCSQCGGTVTVRHLRLKTGSQYRHVDCGSSPDSDSSTRKRKASPPSSRPPKRAAIQSAAALQEELNRVKLELGARIKKAEAELKAERDRNAAAMANLRRSLNADLRALGDNVKATFKLFAR